MKKEIIEVNGMSCQHCVQTIEGNIGAMSGITTVSVDLTNKTVAVEYDESTASLAQIKEAIDDLGYDVQ